MEDDMWGVSSKKYRLEELAKYQSGSYIDFEEIEGEIEMAVDYPCPFCSDDYDLLELCHHIDEEHQIDANNGICPVCSRRVKMNMVVHITTHHKDILKLEQNHKLYKDESVSEFFQGTKKYLHTLNDELLSTNQTSKSVPDPLLSFIYNSPLPSQSKLVKPVLITGETMEDKSSVKDSTEKDRTLLSPLSDTELLEKAKKREFVQGLISSAMFNQFDDF